MRLEEQIVVEAPREEVWRLVGDPTAYPRFMPGVSHFDPEGPEGPAQLGARYSMHMRVGSVEAGGLVEIVEFDGPNDMAWTSITGIDQRGRWRLRDAGEGRTRVVLRLSYGAPGGLVGALADRLSAREVRGNLRRSLQRLKAEVEGGTAPEPGRGLLGSLAYNAGSLRVLVETGVARPVRPDKLARVAATISRWGHGPAAGYMVSAILHPDEPAILDELGTLTFGEVHSRTNRLAHALSDAGVNEGDGVGIMCRNHRGFVEATVAVAKL
ncbi:MAG: SRPBCC family protein, partial [Actinomycetota bacterium]|nr:SRPBCC family protein [Actinomycetota bacterium]